MPGGIRAARLDRRRSALRQRPVSYPLRHPKRLKYQRLQQILRKGDVLVTWEASRAQRDLKAYVALRDLCAERGVMWSYSGALFDLSKADDRFRTGLDALRSEDEAEKTRERILRAHRANLDTGRPHGQPPFGYRIDRDPDTGKPVSGYPMKPRRRCCATPRTGYWRESH